MEFTRTVTETEDMRKVITYTNDKWKIYRETGRSAYGNKFHVISLITKDKFGQNEWYGEFTTLKDAKAYINLF